MDGVGRLCVELAEWLEESGFGSQRSRGLWDEVGSERSCGLRSGRSRDLGEVL